jgi:hypothetical protein
VEQVNFLEQDETTSASDEMKSVATKNSPAPSQLNKVNTNKHKNEAMSNNVTRKVAVDEDKCINQTTDASSLKTPSSLARNNNESKPSKQQQQSAPLSTLSPIVPSSSKSQVIFIDEVPSSVLHNVDCFEPVESNPLVCLSLSRSLVGYRSIGGIDEKHSGVAIAPQEQLCKRHRRPGSRQLLGSPDVTQRERNERNK